jgi:hypothetical protein
MKLVPKGKGAENAPIVRTANTKGSQQAARALNLFQKNLNAINNGQPIDPGPVELRGNRTPEELGVVSQSQSMGQQVSNSNSAISNEIAKMQDNAPSNVGSASLEAPADATSNQALEPAKEDQLSSKYAALARRERANQARLEAEHNKIRAREAEIANREAAIKAKEAEYQGNYIPKSRLQQDTLAALSDAGLDYDQITNLMLQQQNAQANPIYDNKIRLLENQVNEMRQQAEANKKLAEEQNQVNYKTALSQIETDIKRAVRGNPDFETIDKTGSHSEVLDLIEAAYNEGLGRDYPKGTILDIYDAAKMVEEVLTEDLYKQAMRVSKVNKRLSTASQPAKAQQAPKQAELKTLTNNISSSSKQLSSRERAVLAFQGKLN